MVDTERAGPDDGPERTEDEDLPGDGSVTPLSSTGDVDALRTPEPDGQDGAAPLPLETPLE